MQCYVGKCLTACFLEKNQKHLICSICQLPWYKYFYHDQFLATNIMLLNTELEDMSASVHDWICVCFCAHKCVFLGVYVYTCVEFL